MANQNEKYCENCDKWLDEDKGDIIYSSRFIPPYTTYNWRKCKTCGIGEEIHPVSSGKSIFTENFFCCEYCSRLVADEKTLKKAKPNFKKSVLPQHKYENGCLTAFSHDCWIKFREGPAFSWGYDYRCGKLWKLTDDNRFLLAVSPHGERGYSFIDPTCYNCRIAIMEEEIKTLRKNGREPNEQRKEYWKELKKAVDNSREREREREQKWI